MDLRSLLAKMDELSEDAAPAAAPAWAPTPEQAKWLGGANQQDPYILSRMPGAKPPVNWFKDPADQAVAQRMGFPAQAAPAAPVSNAEPVAPVQTPQQTRAAQSNDTIRTQAMAKLQGLLQQLRAANPTLKEGFNLNANNTVTLLRHDGSQVTFDPTTMKIVSNMASSLMESFGYTEYMSESDLMEYGWDQFASDAGDVARGAWQGATLGTGNNIAAGVKSAFGSGTYKDNLAKQVAADKQAQERSPWLYGAGNVAGALAMPVPGAAVAGNLVRGASTAAKVAKGAVQVGANLATQAAINKGVNVANTKTLGYNPDEYPTTPQAIKAFQQANGLTADGIIGPKTKAVLDKLGLQPAAPATVQEQIASLSQRLAMIETKDEQLDELFGIPAGAMSKLGSTVSGAVPKAWQAVKDYATKPAAGKQVTNAAGDTFQWLGNQWAKVNPATGKAGQIANKATAAELNAATTGVKNLPKNIANTVKNNPGKAAAGALAGAGAAMALGGGGSTPVAPKPTTGGKPTVSNRPAPGQAGSTTANSDPSNLIAQIQAEMAKLSDYADGGDQEALALVQQAQQAIDSLQGNTAQAAADVANVPQQPAAAPVDTAGDPNTLTVYGKDAADTAAKTAAARAAAQTPAQ